MCRADVLINNYGWVAPSGMFSHLMIPRILLFYDYLTMDDRLLPMIGNLYSTTSEIQRTIDTISNSHGVSKSPTNTATQVNGKVYGDKNGELVIAILGWLFWIALYKSQTPINIP